MYSKLLESLDHFKFSHKTLKQWDDLYKYYNIHLCAKQQRLCNSIEDMLSSGHRYFACVNGTKHYCQVVPIIIGTKLDRMTRRVDEDEWYATKFRTYVLHSGFFSNITQYITNNVGHAHKFQSRIHTTGRLFIVNKKQHSFMLYIHLPSEKLFLRTPSKEEIDIDNIELVSDLDIDLCNTQKYLANMRLQDLKTFLNALRLSETDIDNIENKIIITGAYLYQQALQLIVPEELRNAKLFKVSNNSNNSIKSIDTSRIKSINSIDTSRINSIDTSRINSINSIDTSRINSINSIDTSRINSINSIDTSRINSKIGKDNKIIKSKIGKDNEADQIIKRCLSGRLQFLVSKKKLFFNKNDQLKYINKQMSNNKHTPQASTIFSNANETIVEEQTNLVRRISSKNSKFLKAVYPSDSEGIINLFYLANLNSAGKSMNLTFHTRITFVFIQDMEDYFEWLVDYLDDLEDNENGQTIVFNNYIYPRKVCADVWKLKLQDQRINISLFQNYLICNLQNGRTQRLVLVNGNDGYCSNCNLMSHQRFTPYINSEPLQNQCHVWMSNQELKTFGTMSNPKFYELMCPSSIKTLCYANVNEISKSISAVRTFRHHFNHIENRNINLMTNKELSRGFIIGDSVYLKLFTLFYDFKGLTVQDGYLLNQQLKLPIMIATKHSIIMKCRGKIYMEKLFSINHYSHESEMRIVKLYSAEPIQQLSLKKVVLELLSHSNSTYIYLVKLIQINNIINYIDESSIQLHVVNNKSSLVLHVLFKTREDILYPIKISNAYSQKGMCNITDLSVFKRANGQNVDLIANPTSLITRNAIGQLKEIMDTKEKVYLNGEFIGYGGYCKYFIPNIFPHDDIHGSQLTNSMRLDRLTFDALLAGNQLRAVNILNTDHFTAGHWNSLKKHINLMNMVGVQIENKFNSSDDLSSQIKNKFNSSNVESQIKNKFNSSNVESQIKNISNQENLSNHISNQEVNLLDSQLIDDELNIDDSSSIENELSIDNSMQYDELNIDDSSSIENELSIDNSMQYDELNIDDSMQYDELNNDDSMQYDDF